MWAMPAQRPCCCRFEEVFTVATLRSALRSCIPGVGARAGTPFSADYGRILRTRSRAIVPIQTHDAALSRDWFREGGLSEAISSSRHSLSSVRRLAHARSDANDPRPHRFLLHMRSENLNVSMEAPGIYLFADL